MESQVDPSQDPPPPQPSPEALRSIFSQANTLTAEAVSHDREGYLTAAFAQYKAAFRLLRLLDQRSLLR